MPSISSLLEKYGAVPIVTTFPEPTVEWLSPDEFERQYGYRPGRVEETLSDRERAAVTEKKRLSLTEDRLTAFDRLARLWNGEVVGPGAVHLLADRVPSWRNITADLDDDELDALHPPATSVDEEYLTAFGDYEWFDPASPRRWLKSTHIARKRADYDIEERARTLMNGREDLPDLRGDPHEGLTHRVGVGVEAARATFAEDRRVETYVPIGDYVVDLLEYDRGLKRERVAEVLTSHNNNRLYRATYRKIEELDRPAVLVFDDRSTARRVLNHWNERCVKVPGAPFESSLNVSWTRKKFAEAASDSSCRWPVEDVLTITTAWDDLEEASPSRRDLLSLNW
ncbi:hypothetical protein SAMN06269185_3330 [Natronoarchaeum philippinense]|uniref:Uncharacterized protein n=1 Tax=Natronoarchaeum philippinense TaxID=558529 RepID=A0A285P9A9_NATPI|nr:hypothetical protein [Natronoarchaeum philippinense]SNZ18330.1 hypothetical protein SAMN06269185_3330 [Natronoarchaeum philippinense]